MLLTFYVPRERRPYTKVGWSRWEKGVTEEGIFSSTAPEYIGHQGRSGSLTLYKTIFTGQRLQNLVFSIIFLLTIPGDLATCTHFNVSLLKSTGLFLHSSSLTEAS